ncbi:MAG: radical SAM protein [Eubacteriales bacterium]|nr:radical SAM protein [Eubacteriales bacterium]
MHAFKGEGKKDSMAEPKSLTLHAGVRMRRESFGGIIFDTTSGTMIEVDREAYQMLCNLRDADPSASVIQTLRELGFLKEGSPPLPDFPGDLSADWPTDISLSAPETVHWAITYRCNADCVDCYAKRNKGGCMELDTAQAARLIKLLADWGVFQLAIGGGEPLLRGDLAEIAGLAKEQGLVTHVTTGDHSAALAALPSLAQSVASLHLGLKFQQLLAEPSKELKNLREFVTAVHNAGLATGVNLPLCNMVIKHFDELIFYLAQAGFKRIILLRYKPPFSEARWRAENPTGAILKEFETQLAATIRNHSHISFRVDCALSFMQRSLTPQQAAEHGIRGCVAASRIISLGPDATVYPCSQLTHPDMAAGNLLIDSPEEVWRNATRIKKYRSFRQKKAFKHSYCGICRAKDQCGGCRVFSDDALGGDPGCPEPMLPGLTELGPIGRRLDLENYLSGNSCIFVEDYMLRYGVGQAKAIKELRAEGLLTADGDNGRKKGSLYFARNTISEIIEMIGSTPGGVPFVSREEVAAWLEEEDSHNYPAWIKRKRWRD